MVVVTGSLCHCQKFPFTSQNAATLSQHWAMLRNPGHEGELLHSSMHGGRNISSPPWLLQDSVWLQFWLPVWMVRDSLYRKKEAAILEVQTLVFFAFWGFKQRVEIVNDAYAHAAAAEMIPTWHTNYGAKRVPLKFVGLIRIKSSGYQSVSLVVESSWSSRCSQKLKFR